MGPAPILFFERRKFMEDGLIDDTFQGRKIYKSPDKDFSEFIDSIPMDEWSQWKITVEGDLITTLEEYIGGLNALAKKGKNVIMLDQKNKIIQHLSLELYQLNLDKGDNRGPKE
jgi:hypothetical protein